MNRSLQTRLLALVLSLVAAAWLVTGVLTWSDSRHELDELLDGHLAQAAALLVVQQAGKVGGSSSGEDDEDEHPDRGIDAPSLHRYAPQVAFQVFHNGALVMRSTNAPAAPMFGAQREAATESGAQHGPAAQSDDRPDDHTPLQRGFATVRIAGEPWRVFAARGNEGDVQVYVGEAIGSRDAISRAVLRSALLPMLLGLPLLGLAVWWAVRHALRPLRKLSGQLRERRPDALNPVDLDDAPTEVVPVVEALNALFGRMGQLLDSERRFTADAAHELRTPIAGIRAQAQVALGESDAALRRHALQSTLAGCDRATRLVDQLLMLARVEARAASGATAAMSTGGAAATPDNANATATATATAAAAAAAGAAPIVDLSALTQRILADLAPKALGTGQTLGLDAPTPVLLAGDEALLGVLVRNLVDNALRYSPAGAHVAVTVQQGPEGPDSASLQVEDSGPGMAPADQARLGERFFRVLGTDAPGSGLGWSIVRRIAAVHGLKVEVTSSERLGGLSVRVLSGTR